MSSIDERLEFLLQSTESLHASTQQLHAIAATHDHQISSLIELAERNERRWYRVMRAIRDALSAGLDGE